MPNEILSDEAYEDAFKHLREKWGAGFDEHGLSEAEYEAFPTGYDDLDEVLTRGAKGIYRGGIVEIFGPEGSGKSSVAMRTCGEAQKSGFRCTWVDAESGFAPDLSLINGCNPAKLHMPDLTRMKMKKSESGHFLNANQVLDLVYDVIAAKLSNIVVVDSVAALMPDRILQESFDPNKVGVAEVARAMSELLKKIVPVCQANGATAIFINQLRDKPGTMFGDPETTPGGRALKFYASQRIRVERVFGKNGSIMLIDEEGDEKLSGHYARARIVKNKRNAPTPFDIQIPIYYVEYFPDDAKRIYDASRSLKVVTIRKGTLTWKDDKKSIIVQEDGEANFLAKLREEPKLIARLAQCCVDAVAIQEKEHKEDKKKEVYMLSNSIRQLAATYNPLSESGPQTEAAPEQAESTEESGKKKRGRKKKDAALDLDEEA